MDCDGADHSKLKEYDPIDSDGHTAFTQASSFGSLDSSPEQQTKGNPYFFYDSLVNPQTLAEVLGLDPSEELPVMKPAEIVDASLELKWWAKVYPALSLVSTPIDQTRQPRDAPSNPNSGFEVRAVQVTQQEGETGQDGEINVTDAAAAAVENGENHDNDETSDSEEDGDDSIVPAVVSATADADNRSTGIPGYVCFLNQGEREKELADFETHNFRFRWAQVRLMVRPAEEKSKDEPVHSDANDTNRNPVGHSDGNNNGSHNNGNPTEHSQNLDGKADAGNVPEGYTYLANNIRKNIRHRKALVPSDKEPILCITPVWAGNMAELTRKKSSDLVVFQETNYRKNCLS